MQPIPTPQLLDPDRLLDNSRGDVSVDHQSHAQLLDEALHETCSYAQQLWHDLNTLRSYLLTSLPPDPRTPDLHPTGGASPTGPDDEDGWENWINAYATVTSVLCGPHGDSGYGLGEGRREAALRRSAPVLRVQAEHSNLTSELSQVTHDQATNAGEQAPQRQPHGEHRSRIKRTAATALLVLLALRGLRPCRVRPSSTGY